MTKGPYNLMPDGLAHSLRSRKARDSGQALTVMFEIQGRPSKVDRVVKHYLTINLVDWSFFSREFQCRLGFILIF